MLTHYARRWEQDGEALKSFPMDVLAMKDLEELNLYGCFEWKKITIPAGICKLKKLARLAIGMARIESLPETLGNLTALVDLDLNYAEELKSLPASLGKLRSLEKLQLSYANKLKALPPSIGKLTNLVELTADPSDLRAVPPTLWGAKNLRVLTLPDTVKKLPPGISKLANLETLAIGPEALASIAGELPKLTKLKTLRIWGKAKTVPDSIGSLANLRDLELLYLEELPALPASITQLAELKKLDVSGCGLKHLASIVCALPKLKELEYGENKIPLAERRLVEKLMRLPPNKRKTSGVVAASAPIAKPELVGSVASVNAYLATLLVDGKVAPAWRGVGDDEEHLEKSDWARFGKTVGKKLGAPIRVGSGEGIAVAMAIGQGIARVYRVGKSLAIVESFADNEHDPLYLEYVASAPKRAKTIGTLAVPSGALAITPSTDGCADVAKKIGRLDAFRGLACGADRSSLLVRVDKGHYHVLVEDKVERSWGSGRRTVVQPR